MPSAVRRASSFRLSRRAQQLAVVELPEAAGVRGMVCAGEGTAWFPALARLPLA
jgi:hypothetical protein